MKSKTILTIMVISLLFLCLSEPVRAQGYATILDKITKLEKRISSIEENLEGGSSHSAGDNSDFENSISSLQSEIDNLKNGIPKGISELPEIKGSIASLETDVSALKADNSQSEQVKLLTNDLKGIVSELRNNFSAHGDAGNKITVGEDIPLEIGGFGEVYAESRQDGEASDDFHLGQVEVGLETNFEEKLFIGAAIAYEAHDGLFAVGAFTVDFHLWDSEGGFFPAVNGIDHSGIIAGQFDVPFGIDWHVYPSIDRKLVTAPLIVESTHDGWNDYGVMGYVENPYFNAILYGTNGFGYEDGVDINDEPIEVTMNFSTGGRLGVTPHEYFEFGGSYAGFFNEESKIDMMLVGADLQFNYEGFSTKGEYIAHTTAIESDTSITNTGYYAQGLYSFGKYFAVARYGVFSPDEEGVDDLTRTSFGGGWAPTEAFELRYEYQANSEDADDVSYFQLVVGF